MGEPDLELRVGDDERRAVDARLHRAVGEGRLTLAEYEERAGRVWAARTRGDLAEVVRDLPGGSPAREGGTAPHRVVAVLGTERLDLRRDDLPPVVQVRAVAVGGEVEVLVPAGTTVRLSGGAAVLGERRLRTGPAAPGGCTVHLDAVAVLGTVTVRSADVATGWRGVAQRARGKDLVSPAAVAPARRRSRAGRLALLGGALLLGGYVAVAGVDTALGDGTVAVMSGTVVQVGPERTDVDAAAVMGGAEVRVAGTGAAVQVGARTLMGGVDVRIGERGSTLERQVVVDARALMGGVTVVVPDGARVELSGAMVMGGSTCEAACAGTGPVQVRVDARGAMGGVDVLTWSEAAGRGVLED